MSRDVSLTGRHNTTLSISRAELDAFDLLCGHGLDTRTTIQLAFQDHKRILKELDRGRSLLDVLTKGQAGKVFSLLRALKDTLPYQECMICVKAIEEGTNKLQKQLLSRLGYPLFLFSFAFFMILFFTDAIMPSLLVYDEGNTLFYLQVLKYAFILLFILILAFALCWVLFLVQNSRSTLFSKVILSVPLLRQVYTYEFSAVLKALLESGLSTADCLRQMQKMKKLRGARYHAFRLLHRLEDGYALEEAIRLDKALDPQFLFFLESGLQTMSLPALIELYDAHTLQVVQTKLKKAAGWIQALSYACVGALVLVVYQAMLLPLSMVTG